MILTPSPHPPLLCSAHEMGLKMSKQKLDVVFLLLEDRQYEAVWLLLKEVQQSASLFLAVKRLSQLFVEELLVVHSKSEVAVVVLSETKVHPAKV